MYIYSTPLVSLINPHTMFVLCQRSVEEGHLSVSYTMSIYIIYYG